MMSQDTPDTPETAGSAGATPFSAADQHPDAHGHDYDDDLADEYDDDLAPAVPVRPSLVARLGAEAFGTFALVLVALGVALYTSISAAGSLGTALGVGLVYIGGALALGRISGAHFNPALTFGAAIAGRTAWRDVVPYWVAQLAGAVLAGAVLLLTIPKALPGLLLQTQDAGSRELYALTANGYDAQSPLAVLSQGQAEFGLVAALLVEVLATAALVGVALASTGARGSRRSAPFAIGLTYGALVLMAAPITGGGLNPARSTAAALFAGGDALGQLWLFWVAPLVGALLAGLVAMALSPHAPAKDDLLGEPAEVTEVDVLEIDETVAPR